MRIHRPARSHAFFLACGLACLAPSAVAQETAKSPPSRGGAERSRKRGDLRINGAVVCRSIEGYEDYEVLPDSALTSEEKLQIYYRPLGYKTEHRGDDYLVHMTQDGQIRRKGEKAVLRRKKNILDYEAKSRQPIDHIFMKNSVPLKGLPPGEYEYDIILRDVLAPGTSEVRSLRFQVIPPSLNAGAGKRRK